jgi:hypothetical protein
MKLSDKDTKFYISCSPEINILKFLNLKEVTTKDPMQVDVS